MDDLIQIAKDINTISKYLSKRDIESLTKTSLEKKYGILQADLLIVIGGIIPYGCDIAAKAFIKGIAKKLFLVGGEGHTTKVFRNEIHRECPDIITDNQMEAEIIRDYFKLKYQISKCFIEKKSTNCGENAKYTFELVKENGLEADSIILIQDATMQRRIDATFQKEWANQNCKLINYAPYIAEVYPEKGGLKFKNDTMWGMWTMEHYIELILGEIPRLMDDANGYGPKGKDYIIHVDIPKNVMEAFGRLKEHAFLQSEKVIHRLR